MQTARTCPDRRTLFEFLVGNVPEAEAEELQRHLASCAACTRMADAQRPPDAFVKMLRAGASAVNEPTHIDRDLLDRLRGLVHDVRAQPGQTTRSPSTDDFLEAPQRAGELGRFGPYRVIERLGRGATGIVYLARQERPARLVALKVLAGAAVAGGRRLARFRAETDVISSLRHANVVHVYEAGEHAGLPYYTMEHLEGGSLAQKLAVAPLSPRDAAVLVKTLAEAIALAHDQRVVHRDLKPSNILLAADGTPKIADFGLAKYLHPDEEGRSETETGAILGTPGYMAPEQSVGEVGPSVDIYALGAILYESLTGRPPFKGATVIDTLQQARSDEPVPPTRLQPGVPPDLQAVCLKCLEKNPEHRYRTARELGDDVSRFLRGEPTRARPVTAFARFLKWARRKPALAGLAAVSVVAAAAGTIGMIVHNAQLSREVQRAAASEARAQKQQDLMAVHYEAARSALDQILAQLQSASSADLPRVKEMRRKVLEQTLAFYQTAARDEIDLPPGMLRDLAIAYRRISQIHGQLGDPTAALRAAREAVRLAEKLVALQPDNAEYQDTLAGACIALGDFVQYSGARLGESEKSALFRKAIAIYEGLCQRQPANPAWRQKLATGYHDLAGVSYSAARMLEAETLYTQAIENRRFAVEQRPDEASYRLALAEDELSLGLAESHARHSEAAEKSYREADRLLKELISAHPQDDAYLITLGALYVNWAFLIGSRGESQQALTLLGQGIQRLNPVLEREPGDQVARERLINLHGARAQTYEALRRFADAISDWEAVVALENRPGLAALRRFGLANALARAGIHERAAAELSNIAGMPEAKGELLYNIACVYAVCIDAARGDSHSASAARGAATERYAARAMEALEKLRSAGYFKSPKTAELLEQDSDLQPLRGRQDFRGFLQRVKGR